MIKGKVNIAITVLAITASGAALGSLLYRLLAADKVAIASFYILIDKKGTSASKQLEKSRDHLTSFFEKDLPFYFSSADGKKNKRGHLSCKLYKEEPSNIEYRCQAKARIKSIDNLTKGTAYLYRMSINGYPRNETSLLARIEPTKTKDTSKYANKDFFDPINHPETGDPTLQTVTVPANTYATINPGRLAGDKETTGSISSQDLILGSLGTGLALATAMRKSKKKPSTSL